MNNFLDIFHFLENCSITSKMGEEKWQCFTSIEISSLIDISSALRLDSWPMLGGTGQSTDGSEVECSSRV